MEVSRIIAEIDSQILKLQQARALLTNADQPVRSGPGRPKGSGKASTVSTTSTRKRKLSPEGRKRIADAMKKRWAERRKQTSAKTATKTAAKTPAKS